MARIQTPLAVRNGVLRLGLAILTLAISLFWVADAVVAQLACSPGSNASLAVAQTDTDPFDLNSQSQLFRLTYTTTIENIGSHCAENVQLFDLLPSDALFQFAVPSHGSCFEFGGTVQCLLGNLPPGATATVKVTIEPFNESTLVNTVNVFSDQTALIQVVEETVVAQLSPIFYNFCGEFEQGVFDCPNKLTSNGPVSANFSVDGIKDGTSFTVSTVAPFAILDPSKNTYKSSVSFVKSGSDSFNLSMRVTLDLNQRHTVLSNGDILYIENLTYDFDNGVSYSRFVTAVGTTSSSFANQPPVATPQTLAVAANKPKPIWLRATDPEDMLVSFEIVSSPAHGTLSLPAPFGPRSSYGILYSPADNFNGSDSFTFSVNDGSAVSNTATINLLVAPASVPLDFNLDGKSDIGVYRNGLWIYRPSSGGANVAVQFGGGTDIPLPADYDGDRRTDIAVYRGGLWIYKPSSGGNNVATQFGGGSDVPLPADYDGDGKADIVVYRNGLWIILKSSDGFVTATWFGGGSDVPVPADYDGDGKADIAVYRNGFWIILRSSDSGVTATQFGGGTDVPISADYDGDGKADIAVYRNGLWIILRSSDNGVTATQFGGGSDVPVPADYDGDGKTDIAVYRNGLWIYQPSSGGGNVAVQFGGGSDVPLN